MRRIDRSGPSTKCCTCAGAGWLTLDDATLASIVSVVNVLASIALTWWTRRKVTSLAHPRAVDGTLLVPAAPPDRPVE
ncbi:hypothetical protein [Saccharopolyspora pogona]|uniref:hypothetical protein n=1 Tax=Saccharopolyspora pogona TaxID=333966 RepID=UPI0016844AC6|nr:hypothetical protein [Saccharopolyspora pogona]